MRNAPDPRLLLGVLIAVLCHACWGASACEQPRKPIEDLPYKLWLCSTVNQRCRIFARFETEADCEEYLRLRLAQCDPNAPKGHLNCAPIDGQRFSEYLRKYHQECTREDLTFTRVNQDGGWTR